jgi:hypothetical protein
MERTTLRAGLFGQHFGLSVQVALSREVYEPASPRQAVARLGERAVVFLQLLAAGADIEVGFRIVGEVAAREGSVRALGLCRTLSRAAQFRAPRPANPASRPIRPQFKCFPSPHQYLLTRGKLAFLRCELHSVVALPSSRLPPLGASSGGSAFGGTSRAPCAACLQSLRPS